MKKITSKQQAFIDNKLAGCTNRDAAIAAGYSVSAASSTADKLMQHPTVRAALKAAGKVAPGGSAPRLPREHYDDPKDMLLDVMNMGALPIAVRADAAKQLMPYMHARVGEMGKKDSALEKAKDVVGGKKNARADGQPKFAPGRAPNIVQFRPAE